MRLNLFISFPLILLLASCNHRRQLSAEQISLSPVYASSMVLQVSPGISIHGRANPGGILAVRIGNYRRLAEADEKGDWQVEFPEIVQNEPFSIRFEGKDTSFTFTNIHGGRIVILAGDGDLSAISAIRSENKVSRAAQLLRIFVPAPKGYDQPQKVFIAGKWLPLAEALKNLKTAYVLTNLRAMIPEHDLPLGIIDLTWPGSTLESWLPSEDSLLLKDLNITAESIDSAILLNKRMLQQILAMKDTCREGLKNGAARIWYNDENWRTTDLPSALGTKDDYQKRRIVYLRKRIYIPSQYLASDFYINLEHVHGIAEFFFNDVKIDSRPNPEGKSRIVVPDSLLRLWTNILTIRLFCTDSLAGLYGNDFTCYTADSGYYRTVNTDWKYTFNLEPEFPELNAVEKLQSLAYNSLLSPAKNIHAEAIIFQFSNRQLIQTRQIAEKFYTLVDALPEPWDKLIAIPELSQEDTLLYNISNGKLDSIAKRITEDDGFTVRRMGNNQVVADK